jgi:hypothetical protein
LGFAFWIVFGSPWRVRGRAEFIETQTLLAYPHSKFPTSHPTPGKAQT